jgi:serine/threonine protein kinase
MPHDLIPGGCLDQLLDAFGSFGEKVIRNYVQQITDGTAFLHKNGIIHRDLKGSQYRVGIVVCINITIILI